MRNSVLQIHGKKNGNEGKRAVHGIKPTRKQYILEAVLKVDITCADQQKLTSASARGMLYSRKVDEITPHKVNVRPTWKTVQSWALFFKEDGCLPG